MIAFTNTDDTVYPNLPPVGERTSPLLISTTIQYPPARGGTVRVLDNVHTIGLRNITSNYLRKCSNYFGFKCFKRNSNGEW